jgi:hypothetical protein
LLPTNPLQQPIKSRFDVVSERESFSYVIS